MWFVFPQITKLKSGPVAKPYAITSRAEAGAYPAHPVLGPRLVACAGAAAAVPGGAPARAGFGPLDDIMLRSSATLCASVPPAGCVFERVLDR